MDSCLVEGPPLALVVYITRFIDFVLVFIYILL